jgi:hypothetical protein
VRLGGVLGEELAQRDQPAPELLEAHGGPVPDLPRLRHVLALDAAQMLRVDRCGQPRSAIEFIALTQAAFAFDAQAPRDSAGRSPPPQPAAAPSTRTATTWRGRSTVARDLPRNPEKQTYERR